MGCRLGVESCGNPFFKRQVEKGAAEETDTNYVQNQEMMMSAELREDRVSSKEWPVVRNENSDYCGKGNEWELGKDAECYLLFQRFCCEKQYNCSGYELGLEPDHLGSNPAFAIY